ncbi:uncharacterized protein LOC100898993 [Galendromus occidentalis]|uniref:Uncharacterized protein LOC100898993 n=1 Tax=Galendromus occidentalis TaxID=34638 RepID=A0AAJ6QUM9_9ACAR|nr:uncharacterized protein LOC100898993 [Galendromus occidentalis]
MKQILILLLCALMSEGWAATPVSREINLKNYCIERKATLENVEYLQGRIDHGQKLWHRTRKNLETARDGLRKHAGMLEEKISAEGADHAVVCQGRKDVRDTANSLAESPLIL